MSDKKMRAVRMTDEEFEDCVRVAGNRNFSPWAADLLLAAARFDRTKPGTVEGGLCSGKAGACGRLGAWNYLRNCREFVCDECLEANPVLKTYAEDRRPKIDAQNHREVLIQAVVHASSMLLDYDRSHPRVVDTALEVGEPSSPHANGTSKKGFFDDLK